MQAMPTESPSSTPVKTINTYSESLQEWVTLEGDAMEIYQHFRKSLHFHDQTRDPAHYLQLANLGYTATDMILLQRGNNPSIESIIKLGIDPEVAPHVARYIGVVSRFRFANEEWIKTVIPTLDVTKIQDFEDAGWSHYNALMLSAFPEHETRFKEAKQRGIITKNGLVNSDYDVAMLARLSQRPGSNDRAILVALDKGYTEKEIIHYGFLLTSQYDAFDLRASTVKTAALKSLGGLFRPAFVGRDSQRRTGYPITTYVPTLAQLEALINTGLTTGTTYRAAAKMVGGNIFGEDTVIMVTKVLERLNYDDLVTVYMRLGVVTEDTVNIVNTALNAGYPLDAFLDMAEAVASRNGGRASVGEDADVCTDVVGVVGSVSNRDNGGVGGGDSVAAQAWLLLQQGVSAEVTKAG